MKPTLTQYETRIASRVYLGGIQIGSVEVVKRHDGHARAVKIRGWCGECLADIDANGREVADFDHTDARYHASAESAAEAIGKHALTCDDAIAEMAKHARTVAA